MTVEIGYVSQYKAALGSFFESCLGLRDIVRSSNKAINIDNVNRNVLEEFHRQKIKKTKELVPLFDSVQVFFKKIADLISREEERIEQSIYKAYLEDLLELNLDKVNLPLVKMRKVSDWNDYQEYFSDPTTVKIDDNSYKLSIRLRYCKTEIIKPGKFDENNLSLVTASLERKDGEYLLPGKKRVISLDYSINSRYPQRFNDDDNKKLMHFVLNLANKANKVESIS